MSCGGQVRDRVVPRGAVVGRIVRMWWLGRDDSRSLFPVTSKMLVVWRVGPEG